MFLQGLPKRESVPSHKYSLGGLRLHVAHIANDPARLYECGCKSSEESQLTHGTLAIIIPPRFERKHLT